MGRVYFPDVNAAAAAAAARDWTDLLGKGGGACEAVATYIRTHAQNKAIFYLLGWVPNGKKTAPGGRPGGPPPGGGALLLPTWTDVLRVTVPVVGRGRVLGNGDGDGDDDGRG
ncbi:hypothetical protein Purlil1_2518 [Purpureocillium lilacinum]|uniref:Uncharacterized protein n=1 Tax=Purpureocillium lilacinum TaxID=33203 RepID=A0ABR0CBR0_PURLI|nr:hypothetical protein Purlil1_2518 [Purpureocillium lilacinum]